MRGARRNKNPLEHPIRAMLLRGRFKLSLNDMKRVATLSVVCAVLPMYVQAQAVFTEIMYDPPSTDSESGGEWVEVFVTGSEGLDFSPFRIGDKTGTSGSFSNRSITHVLGNSEVYAGEYAVIAKNADQIRTAFP